MTFAQPRKSFQQDDGQTSCYSKNLEQIQCFSSGFGLQVSCLQQGRGVPLVWGLCEGQVWKQSSLRRDQAMIEATNFHISRGAYSQAVRMRASLAVSVAEYLHQLGIPLLNVRGLFSAFNRFHATQRYFPRSCAKTRITEPNHDQRQVCTPRRPARKGSRIAKTYRRQEVEGYSCTTSSSRDTPQDQAGPLLPADQVGSFGMQASHSQVAIASTPAAHPPTLPTMEPEPDRGVRRSIGPCETRQPTRVFSESLYCDLAIGGWSKSPRYEYFDPWLGWSSIGWVILRCSSDVSSALGSSSSPSNLPIAAA